MMIKSLLICTVLIANRCMSLNILPKDEPSETIVQMKIESNGEIGKLREVSTQHSILFGLIKWGDSSIAKAVHKYGGAQVKSIDHIKFNFLGLYSNNSNVVTAD